MSLASFRSTGRPQQKQQSLPQLLEVFFPMGILIHAPLPCASLFGNSAYSRTMLVRDHLKVEFWNCRTVFLSYLALIRVSMLALGSQLDIDGCGDGCPGAFAVPCVLVAKQRGPHAGAAIGPAMEVQWQWSRHLDLCFVPCPASTASLLAWRCGPGVKPQSSAALRSPGPRGVALRPLKPRRRRFRPGGPGGANVGRWRRRELLWLEPFWKGFRV